MVAYGFKQYYSFDYTIAYAPLISLAAVHLVLSEAATRDLEIDQIDVIGAFLKTKVEEKIYLAMS